MEDREWAVERHWKNLFEDGVLEVSLKPFLCNSDSEKDYAHCTAGTDMSDIRENMGRRSERATPRTGRLRAGRKWPCTGWDSRREMRFGRLGWPGMALCRVRSGF